MAWSVLAAILRTLDVERSLWVHPPERRSQILPGHGANQGGRQTELPVDVGGDLLHCDALVPGGGGRQTMRVSALLLVATPKRFTTLSLAQSAGMKRTASGEDFPVEFPQSSRPTTVFSSLFAIAPGYKG